MASLNEILRAKEMEIESEVKRGIDNYSKREVENFSNGNRFVHDGSIGYVLGLNGEIKGWRIKEGLFGGESRWVEAEFSYGDFMGPEIDYSIRGKKFPLFGS